MSLLLANNSGGSSEKEYVDSLFSTFLYQGNGGSQTINNGIDLAGKGGLVMLRGRATVTAGFIFDTAQGVNKYVLTNSTNGQASNTSLTTFNSNGFSLSSAGATTVNDYGNTYASWTFRRAERFFDVVTYTGNGASNRQIAHELGIAPGFITTKATSTTGDWNTYHRSATGDLVLNSTVAQTASRAIITAADASTFTVSGAANTNGVQYVAYIFAHDPSADGIIQCGSFTTDGSGNATVNMGWEPQYLMWKATSTTGNWAAFDTMRGWGESAYDAFLAPNLSGAESISDYGSPTATGFNAKAAASQTYIYLAIRRQNKPPTSETKVYFSQTDYPYVYAGVAGTDKRYPIDLAIGRLSKTSTADTFVIDRLRGGLLETPTATINYPYLTTNTTAAETSSANYQSTTAANYSMVMSGVSPSKHWWAFRRAPVFLSSFAYTGTGSNRTTPHDLAAVPDLLIVKSRSAATDWQVWCNGLAANEKLVLNSNAAKVTDSTAWNSTLPTATNITVGTASATNANNATFIAYAFSSLPGIQKIGTYVGDGTSGRVIDCGFSTGARFVCIKAISTTGSWLVSDSARGIVSGNDPYLQLNSTAAEVTTEDWLDPSSVGFIVNNVSSSNANASGVTYMYWAIA